MSFSHSASIIANDVHSQLNPTKVHKVLQPRSQEDVRQIVRSAAKSRSALSICGGRHAMGGQQFAAGTILVDVRKLNRVLTLDRDAGIIEVEAGIEWPDLIAGYLALQSGDKQSWGIAQKQTGADRLTISGAIAANAHGRGLTMKPFISDVESFDLIDANGDVKTCSRDENADLFRLVHGGYGLFGIVTTVKLRLIPRRKVQRVVEIGTTETLVADFENRIADGFLYGDFQFSVERDSDDFLRKGVFSCYRPVAIEAPLPLDERRLTDHDWRQLLYLAHADPKQAFERYVEHYLATNGQIYWSDLHQLAVYPDNYHREIDARLNASHPATEVITEINVPRRELDGFLQEAREDFRKNKTELIYGTVRLIARDDESFLPWAKQAYACTIFNLHVVHTPESIQRAGEAFQRLIDMAARRNGSYYLTYHRYATRTQVESCYPEFAQFLNLKRHYDPDERFQSDWYRHYREMFLGNS